MKPFIHFVIFSEKQEKYNLGPVWSVCVYTYFFINSILYLCPKWAINHMEASPIQHKTKSLQRTHKKKNRKKEKKPVQISKFSNQTAGPDINLMLQKHHNISTNHKKTSASNSVKAHLIAFICTFIAKGHCVIRATV